MSSQSPEPETAYRAVNVGRRGLDLIMPLVEEFCRSGVSHWDAGTFGRVAWERLGTPLFRVWALVAETSRQPLGFLAAQIQISDAMVELYLLASYVPPGLPLRAGWPMLNGALAWGRLMGCEKVLVRTVRGSANGLAEPHAWERLGFQYDSTILVGDLTPRQRSETKVEVESVQGRAGEEDRD